MTPDPNAATTARRHLLAVLALFLFASLGCTSVGRLIVAPTPTPLPPLLPTLRPTDTTTPTPSITPSPSFTPTPTFTLTPIPIATDTPLAPATPTPPPGPKARITNETANIRGGPGVTFERIAQVNQGQAFDITGVNSTRDWWQICCLADGRSGWILGTLIAVEGDTAALPVSDIATPPPPATPLPTDTPTALPPTPTPSPLFYQGEGPLHFPTENLWLTVWVKVYDRYGTPLPGWRAQVKRNGQLVYTSAPSRDVFEFSAPPNLGNRKEYNIKVEIPEPGSANWELYLIDANEGIQSPIISFSTSLGDPNREKFVGFLSAQ